MNLVFDFASVSRSGSLCHGIPPLALQQITRLAVQSTAQFVQDVGTVHSRALVVEAQQCGVANTRFLPQAVQRPFLSLEDFSKPTENHCINVAAPSHVWQVYYTCMVYFTQQS